MTTLSRWVELIDRGQGESPRYVVCASELSMAGGAQCFIAAMEFASTLARVLSCTVVMRRIVRPGADSQSARSPLDASNAA